MKKPAVITEYTVAQAKKDFEKSLQDLAYTQSLWQVFQDFLDFSLLMLRWWDVKEEMFENLKAKYPKSEQHALFAKAYYAMGKIAEGDGVIDGFGFPAGFKDPFGDYFMEHFSNDHTGQFFTPEEVCDLLAQMTITEDILQDGKTVCDPACGSGRNLLSAGKVARKAGVYLKYYAADIDLTCCKMTVINMMINCLPGEVAHMNTLSLDHWGGWKIDLIPTGKAPLPMYIELKANQTEMAGRIKATFENQPNDIQKKKEPLPNFKKMPDGNLSQITLF